MNGLLLDTHVWIWYLRGSDRLPDGLRRRIDETPDDRWLSTVSIWELGLLVERGRIGLRRTLREEVDDAMKMFPVREAPVSREVAVVSHEIDLPHRDPADRLIAATALTFELMLLTVDERLTGADWLPTLSE